MIDLTVLSDAELAELSRELPHEWTRRENLPAVSAAQAEVVAGLREAGTISAPETPTAPTSPTDYPAWVDPGTDHAAMYLPGDEVSHNGDVWRSEHPGLNHWQPGSAGVDWRIWRNVTDEMFPPEPDFEEPDAPPAWDGQGHAYAVGDLLAYGGQTYRVVQSHTSQGHWTPDAVPALYARQ